MRKTRAFPNRNLSPCPRPGGKLIRIDGSVCAGVHVAPLGGDIGEARSQMRVHTRHWWNGRCRGCGDLYPCRTRLEAHWAMGETKPDSDPGPTGRTVFASGVMAIFSGVLVAAMARWLDTWWMSGWWAS